jgi:hypothetical protein
MSEPKHIKGECNAHLYISDNFGDNETTIRCQLPEGHEGTHCEWFYRGEGKVVISWEKDERRVPETRTEIEAHMERIRKCPKYPTR